MEAVVEVEIENIKGIESLRIQPKALTVLYGANGSGKSSVLDAIEAVFAGGHQPALVRNGEKEGFVRLELSNGVKILKRITKKRSELIITDPEGNEVPRPQQYVESLASGFGFDPLAFLEASPKERLSFLLEALPISFEREEVIRCLKDLPVPYPDAPLDLEGLAQLRQSIYDERRLAHVAEREAEGAVQSLRKALPADEQEAPRDWKAETERLTTEHVNAMQKLQNIIAEINAAETEEVARLRKEFDDACAVVREQARQGRIQAEEMHRPGINRLAAELAAVGQRSEEAGRLAAIREQIEQQAKRRMEHMTRAFKMDRAIEKLDELRKKKLDSFPIQGVEIKDGEIFVDGVPFDEVNTGRLYMLCFEIAAMRHGELPLMIADRSEHLDEDNWRDFCAAASQSGFQVIAARVGEGSLVVSTG